MLREIVKIDEELCDGCGKCIPSCHEGALQIVDGKARLVSEIMCDGLGDCIGHCPQGAISIEKRVSELSHWPVQMHLINPTSSHYRNADVLMSADCVAYTVADFHGKYLRGKKLAIACPKLDHGTDIYIDKIRRLIDEAHIRSLHLVVMEVPCCNGLSRMVQAAQSQSHRKVPVEVTVVNIRGEELRSVNI